MAEAVQDVGGTGFVHTCDLSDSDDVERMAREVLAQHGHVDILVNNAGKSIRRSVDRSYDRFHDYQRTMALNYFAPVKLMLDLLPVMRERGSGHIINISTIGLQINTPRFAAYLASKAALDAFSRSIGPEVIGDGVHITTVYMPLVRTPMIAPTKIYDRLPTLNPEQAAGMISEAIRKRPKKIATTLGNLGSSPTRSPRERRTWWSTAPINCSPRTRSRSTGAPMPSSARLPRPPAACTGRRTRTQPARPTRPTRRRASGVLHLADEHRAKRVGADVASGQHHADALVLHVKPAGQQRREGGGAAGLDHQLHALEEEPHRRDDLGVGHRHDVRGEGLDDGPGELAGGGGLLAVGDRPADVDAHALAGGQRAGHVVTGFGLDADHAGPGRQCGAHGGGARDEPAAAHRHQQDIERVDVCEQLERDRALARHHLWVVERVHEHHAALGGELVDKLLAVLAVALVLHHLGAVALGGSALERRGVVGHQDHGAGAAQPSGQRHRLRVVARGHGAHAPLELIRRQRGDGVVGAAELERAHALEGLALEEYLRAQTPVQRGGGEHRSPVGDPRQALRRPLDVVDGDGEIESGSGGLVGLAGILHQPADRNRRQVLLAQPVDQLGQQRLECLGAGHVELDDLSGPQRTQRVVGVLKANRALNQLAAGAVGDQPLADARPARGIEEMALVAHQLKQLVQLSAGAQPSHQTAGGQTGHGLVVVARHAGDHRPRRLAHGERGVQAVGREGRATAGTWEEGASMSTPTSGWSVVTTVTGRCG